MCCKNSKLSNYGTRTMHRAHALQDGTITSPIARSIRKLLWEPKYAIINLCANNGVYMYLSSRLRECYRLPRFILLTVGTLFKNLLKEILTLRVVVDFS